MAGLKYVLPALAVAAGAAAQSSSCGSAGTTTTIQSSGDATALASCSTYSGSIAIATSATSIALDGIQSIQGDLYANNATQLTSFSADSLQSIGGAFHLESLITLTSLTFPMLEMVDTIFWNAIPNLGGLSFTSGLKQVKMLTIENTFLSSLSGIDLETVETFIVQENNQLTEISMQLGNVSTQFGLNANGKNLKVELPNLIWANNMSIRGASEVDIPSLASVNQSLGFYTDDFQTLSAPNLTNIGGSLTFDACNSLTNVSMPQLTTVNGALQIANNSMLGDIEGFPALQTIGGALTVQGHFTNVSLPSLKSVRGAFNMRSDEDISNVCTHFKQISGPGEPIQGLFSCVGNTTPNGQGSPTSASSSSHTSSAASPMLIPGVTGVLGVVAAIFGLL